MKNKFLNFFFMVLAFCCLNIQNAKADIVDPCVAAAYVCEGDPFSGVETITVIISVDYVTNTFEWLDCVTFTLPAGWTYVMGSEVGTMSDADGNYISDTGNSVTFGAAGSCPGGGSMNSPLGGGPNDFVFVVTPPAGWSAGDCDTPGDGDPISGITWDYAGDAYGEMAPSTPGNNGGPADPFNITDGADCSAFPADAGTIMGSTDVSVCPLTEQANFDVGPVTLPDVCGAVYTIGFDNAMGGTGALDGPFTLTLATPPPYAFDADLNGVLTGNGFAVMAGTWCLTGQMRDGFGVVCSETTNTLCVTYLPDTDPACQPAVCDAVIDAPTITCDASTLTFGANCQLDSEPAPANTATFVIFYETDGTGGAGIIDAVSGYTMGSQILPNLNSGAAGEVVFFGEFGDCTGIPLTAGFTNPTCTPFTLDVYVSTIELNAAGTPVAIDGDCPVVPATLIFNPDQPTVIEIAGDCTVGASAQIGYDNGDGAGGDPDGDFDDPEDFICTTLTSDVAEPFYPCGDAAGANVEGIDAYTSADLEGLFGVTNGTGCYTDLAFTAESVCGSPDCPPCDVVPAVLAGGNETCADGSAGPAFLSEDTAGSGGLTEYVVTDADGSITGTADVIISVGTFAEAEAAIAGLGAGESVCITAMTYVQAELDALIGDLCGGIAASTLGLPDSGNTFGGIFIAIQDFTAPDDPGITIATVEALIGGGGGGPGLGGLADLDALLSGLTCPVPPFCYRLSNTVCAVGGAASCAVCEDPCANNTGEAGDCTYDPDYDVCDDGCPDTADSYNNATCECEFVLTEPDCDDSCPDTADSYDAAACACVNTLTEPDCDDACPNTADSYDAAACACVNTLTEPDCDDGDPATVDTYDVANCQCVNTATCEDPCANNTGATEACTYDTDYDVCDDGCPDTADSYNYATCECEFVLTEPNCDDGCPDTADSYDAAACACVNTLTEPDCDDSCPDTADSYDAAACACVNTLTEPDCDDGNPDTDDSYDAANCACVNESNLMCTDPCANNTGAAEACTYDPDYNVCDDGDCNTSDAYDDATCSCVFTAIPPPDCDDGDPGTTDSYDTATCTCVNTPIPDVCEDPCANNTGADGECTYDADYDVCDDGDCNTLDTYNYDTCECESAVVIPPDCDDGDPTTADSYDETTCMCVNTPINSGCTDALACNYDPAAEVDDGSCYSVGDSCNDGNPLTVNDTWNVSCLCEGEESGEAIPTVGEWGLIILALLLLNLGVLYIRQTEIKIVSE